MKVAAWPGAGAGYFRRVNVEKGSEDMWPPRGGVGGEQIPLLDLVSSFLHSFIRSWR